MKPTADMSKISSGSSTAHFLDTPQGAVERALTCSSNSPKQTHRPVAASERLEQRHPHQHTTCRHANCVTASPRSRRYPAHRRQRMPRRVTLQQEFATAKASCCSGPRAKSRTMSEDIAPHVHFQYADARHQADTAIAGMWLFLATEALFFGGLILAWLSCRHWQQIGFDAGGRETLIAFGTANLALLITSSLVYSAGLEWIRLGQPRRLMQCCWITAAIGIMFLTLKVVEWCIDISNHLFPSGAFKITGIDEGGARLFWSFYFIATGLHAVHLLTGTLCCRLGGGAGPQRCVHVEMVHPGRSDRSLLELRRHRMDRAVSAHLSDRSWCMSQAHRQLLLCWIGLLLLAAVQFGLRRPSVRPVLSTATSVAVADYGGSGRSPVHARATRYSDRARICRRGPVLADHTAWSWDDGSNDARDLSDCS